MGGGEGLVVGAQFGNASSQRICARRAEEVRWPLVLAR